MILIDEEVILNAIEVVRESAFLRDVVQYVLKHFQIEFTQDLL